jgi:hemerythrin-like domain-containing protein
MKPIGPMMWEHRLIERVLRSIETKIAEIKIRNMIDPVFIDTVVDFIRTYADRTHHGKEEDILFRELKNKPLSKEHAQIMNELIEDHIFSRKTVAQLVTAKEDFLKGNKESISVIIKSLETLTVFYPKHIEKEDKHFFYPVFEYFSDEEQNAMLEEFYKFDRKMIHEKYNKVAETIEKSAVNPN